MISTSLRYKDIHSNFISMAGTLSTGISYVVNTLTSPSVTVWWLRSLRNLVMIHRTSKMGYIVITRNSVIVSWQFLETNPGFEMKSKENNNKSFHILVFPIQSDSVTMGIQTRHVSVSTDITNATDIYVSNTARNIIKNKKKKGKNGRTMTQQIQMHK